MAATIASCAVFGCNNSSRKKKCIDAGIKFHSFPKNVEMRKKWLAVCRHPWNRFTTCKVHICSIHFKECYVKKNLQHTLLQYSVRNYRYLTDDAVPTEHLSPPLVEDKSRTKLLGYLYNKFRIASLGPSASPSQQGKSIESNTIEISTADLLYMKLFIEGLESKIANLKEKKRFLFKQNQEVKMANWQLQCQIKELSGRLKTSMTQMAKENKNVNAPQFLLLLKSSVVPIPQTASYDKFKENSQNKDSSNVVVKEEPMEEESGESQQQVDHLQLKIEDHIKFESNGSNLVLQEEFEEVSEMKPELLLPQDLKSVTHEQLEEIQNEFLLGSAWPDESFGEHKKTQDDTLEHRYTLLEQQKINTNSLTDSSIHMEFSKSQQEAQNGSTCGFNLFDESCTDRDCSTTQDKSLICSPTSHPTNSSDHSWDDAFTFVDCNSIPESIQQNSFLASETSEPNLNVELNSTPHQQSQPSSVDFESTDSGKRFPKARSRQSYKKSKTSESDVKRPQSPDGKSTLLTCILCKDTFTHQQFLTFHMRKHFEPRPFACTKKKRFKEKKRI